MPLTSSQRAVVALAMARACMFASLVRAECPLCHESAVLIVRDEMKMCAPCAEHLDFEEALEESYGDAMFEEEEEEE